MAKFLPDRIELTTSEAIEAIAVIDDCYRALISTEWMGLAMEAEEVRAMLVTKLFPEPEE